MNNKVVCIICYAFLSQAAFTPVFAGSADDNNPMFFQSVDIFKLEYADDPRISPDGKRIVYQRMSMDIRRHFTASPGARRT